MLISIAGSALQSKTNTASLENELVELQKSMDKVKKNNVHKSVKISKWKNHAQKVKMER